MKSLFTFHFSLFARWRNRRQQKRKQRETQHTLQMWALLEKLFDAGQISFDRKAHRLFITQPVASLLMSKGAGAWINSIHTIYQYTYLRQSQKAWDEYMQREELAAVRDAMKGHGGLVRGSEASEDHVPVPTVPEDGNSQFSILNSQLSRSDIDRIRLARRQQIAFSDMEPPKVEPFEFFIIPLSTEAKVEPLAVGYYDPNTGEMDVATWDAVKTLLSEASSNH